MYQNVKPAGVRRIDDHVDDGGEVAVLINPAGVFLFRHADRKQADRIRTFAGQRSGKAVRLILVLLDDPEHLGPRRFGNIRVIVDHP